MTKFIISIAMVIIAFAVCAVVVSLTQNLDWGLLSAAIVFVGYILFAIYQTKRIKTLKVK